MEKRITIDCGSFVLRKWMKKDIRSLVKNADNPKVWINLKDMFPNPYTVEEAEKWIASSDSIPSQKNFAIVINKKAAGGIGFHFLGDVYRRNAEIGYWLGEEYWGKGITTKAVGAITSFIFENYDINRIFARVFGWNKASASVLLKNGYKLEGTLRRHVFKNGIFTDELIYGLLKSDE